MCAFVYACDGVEEECRGHVLVRLLLRVYACVSDVDECSADDSASVPVWV